MPKNAHTSKNLNLNTYPTISTWKTSLKSLAPALSLFYTILAEHFSNLDYPLLLCPAIMRYSSVSKGKRETSYWWKHKEWGFRLVSNGEIPMVQWQFLWFQSPGGLHPWRRWWRWCRAARGGRGGGRHAKLRRWRLGPARGWGQGMPLMWWFCNHGMLRKPMEAGICWDHMGCNSI